MRRQKQPRLAASRCLLPGNCRVWNTRRVQLPARVRVWVKSSTRERVRVFNRVEFYFADAGMGWYYPVGMYPLPSLVAPDARALALVDHSIDLPCRPNSGIAVRSIPSIE